MVLLSKVQFVALHGSDDRQSVSEVLRRVESVVTEMAEYIEKEKLRLMKTEECAGHTIEYAMGWKACIDWLKTIPAANVRENVRGAWELHGGDDDLDCYYFCSKCGAGYIKEEWFYVHGKYHPFTFCPNCGAKMEVQDG